MFKFLTKYIISIIFITNFLFSQEDSNVIILHHADSLVGKVVNGENVRELIGNVQFSQGRVLVKCDKAVQYLKSNFVTLEGDIRIQDDTLTFFGKRGQYNSIDRTAEAYDGVYIEEGEKKLFADYGKYFVNEKRVHFRSRVLVQDTSSRLMCDELIYLRNEKKTIAKKNVIISDLKNNIKTYSNYFENQGNYSYISEKPAVVQIDTAEDGSLDTLIILSNEIHSYQDSLESFVLIGDVKMKREKIFAECGESVYFTDTDSIIMKKNPFVWYEETQINGDTIFIKLKNRKLSNILVTGKAFALSLSDTNFRNRFDQMLGATMEINFSDGEINNIVVNQTAKSLYFLYEESSNSQDSSIKVISPNGLNVTTGDQIVISFQNKKVEQIKVTGGVEGKYYPENLIKGKESDYNLEGFNRRIDKPDVSFGLNLISKQNYNK